MKVCGFVQDCCFGCVVSFAELVVKGNRIQVKGWHVASPKHMEANSWKAKAKLVVQAKSAVIFFDKSNSIASANFQTSPRGDSKKLVELYYFQATLDLPWH